MTGPASPINPAPNGRTRRHTALPGPRAVRRAAAGAVGMVALSALLVAGCASDPRDGFSTQSAFPAEITTVAVPILANETFDREIGFQVTQALIREIEAKTPYRVADQARADSILTGRVRSVQLRQLSKSPQTGLGQEVVVEVTIDFEWRDLARDVPLVSRTQFTGHGLFSPSQPVGERIDLGRQAAVERLARSIVDEMQTSW